jgi:hypothetical protein
MALAVVAALGAVEDDDINVVALLGSWALGVFGAIALFQAISRRSSFATVLGGGILSAIAVTLSATAWNTADDTTASYALAILPFAPGAALLSALGAFLVRRRG